jgi:glycosyltransferase involved in cell wall biosynthesis
MNPGSSPRALFVGTTYAGWETRQLNLEAHVSADGRLAAEFHQVTGWRDHGAIERLPLPVPIRGRMRALSEARHFAAFPRPDVVWTSCGELAFPYLWADSGPLKRPLVVETDWTTEQQEEMALIYFDRRARTGPRRGLLQFQERCLLRHVSLFTPISNWAANGLRRLGVQDERIHVLHPGLDLDAWRAVPRPVVEGRPLRLLFVGGDFARKGGHILVDVVRTRFAGEVELDIVTREPLQPVPGIRVHRAEPNSPLLRRLYAAADLFVMPTRAEAFGHVTVEAMASALPSIVSDVGGARDIIDDGVTGWLIAPGADSLASALRHALERRESLPAMGARARAVAEVRFDGARNDRILVDLLLDQAERHSARNVALRRARA